MTRNLWKFRLLGMIVIISGIMTGSIFARGPDSAPAAVTAAAAFKESPAADENFIVLLSDLHIWGASDTPEKYQGDDERTAQICARIVAMNPRPAAVILFGDLAAKRGVKADYEKVKTILAPLDAAGIPWFPMLGNHDRRGPFAEVFPDRVEKTEVAGRFVTRFRARRADFLLLDILDENDAIKEPVLGPLQEEWLADRLAEAERGGKRLFLCAHYPVDLLKIDDLFDRSPALIGCVGGHWHSWNHLKLARGESVSPSSGEGVNMIFLPSCAYRDSVGFVSLYLGESYYAFTLVTVDPSDPHNGETFTIPVEALQAQP